MVTFEMNTGKIIKMEVYPHVAPITAQNFLYLCSIGFYDGTPFHRVIKDFVIQGGAPNGDPYGNPGYRIKGEFMFNGGSNKLRHLRSYVSMARSEDYNSAGSQFFICLTRAPHLDGRYAIFGKVTEGMDVVDEIANVPVDENKRPLEDQYIVKVTLDDKEKINAVRPEVILR